MNNEFITDIFLKANKKKRISGRSDTMSTLMPYLMMDICCQMHNSKISKLGCSFNLRKISREWGRAYTKFNHSLFCLYNDNQKDYIIDKMDSFERYTNEAVDELKELVEEGLAHNKVPFEKRDILSTCLVCNVIAQSAQCIWRQTYLGDRGQEETNMDIQKVERATMQFADTYYKSMADIDLNKFPKVPECVNRLCHIMVEWIAVDAESEEKDKIQVSSWSTWKKNNDYVPDNTGRFRGGMTLKDIWEGMGWTVIEDIRDWGLFKERKALARTMEAIHSQDDVDEKEYEYIYYGHGGHKGEKDFLIVARKKKEEVL